MTSIEQCFVAPDERRSRLALSLLFEPGDPRVTGLVSQLGASQTLALLHQELLRPDLVADAAVRLDRVRPDDVLNHAERAGVRWVVPGDAEWPSDVDALTHAPVVSRSAGPPLGLWVKGQPLDQLVPRVAIVGSRNATTYGTQAAATIAAECAAAGWTVVSGGAYGIDEAAHRAVLAVGGSTIISVAHGLDRMYPEGNADLADAVLERGAMVSELAPGTTPLAMRFLARNRVIAALAAATVVVEAGARSGALNTANWAGQLSRPVLAVPGPTTSSVSVGTHELIRSGAAVLATTGDEVLEIVAAVGDGLLVPRRAPVKVRDRLDARARQVLEAVPVARPAGIESIASTAGVGLLETQTMIRTLCEQALIVFEAGGWRIAAPEDTPEGRSDLN